MNMVKQGALALSLGVILLMGGCMVGPDYERPETVAETARGFV